MNFKYLLLERLMEDDNIDPDIESEPYGDNDIWTGSDIAGMKKGGTGMPHGFGFPNAPKRKRKFDRKYIKDVVSINYVHGVTHEDEKKYTLQFFMKIYRYGVKHMPWVEDYDMFEDIQTMIQNPNITDYNVYRIVEDFERIFSTFIHWSEMSKEEIIKLTQYEHDSWRSAAYDKAHEISKKYPNARQEIEKFRKVVKAIAHYAPDNPKNPAVYPLFVSLYDVTRRLGGYEEGGWYYDANDLIDSKQVNNYKEARKAAVHFLHNLSQADLNGKPYIVLEKNKGGEQREAPEYS